VVDWGMTFTVFMLFAGCGIVAWATWVLTGRDS
jgi:hypothetical protein